MRLYLSVAATLLFATGEYCLAEVARQANYYVAPNGNDANSGTVSLPFATLERARDAVRQQIAAGLTHDVIVHIRGGLYLLDKAVIFGPEDSGTERFSVSYLASPCEKPVLSGGRAIADWRRGTGLTWTVELPEVKAGRWYPRQLFVDGSRRQRARTPNEGFYRGMKSDDGRRIEFPAGQLQAWKNHGDVELVALVEWTASRSRLHQVSDNQLVFPKLVLQFLDGDGLKHIRRNVHNFPYYFENAPEMLDAPGEWYLDRKTGLLSYWPLPGEDLQAAKVTMPRLQRLIEIVGTRERPVRNLRFSGISFVCTDFVPPDPFIPDQAGFENPGEMAPEAAIRMQYAHGCRLDDGRFRQMGGTAVCLGVGCVGNRVCGNLVSGVGANGVEIGTRDPHPDNQLDIVRDNVLANNIVEHCGLDYAGSIGVWVGITDHTTIAHNLIRHVPYTGISVGWRWTPEDTACRRNIVEFNHIHHVVELLADGGGVYLLGSQPGSVLRGNLVHDIVHYSGYAENQGFFLDQGSKGWLVEGNVIYDTADGAVRHNDSHDADQTWRGNSFGRKPGEPGFPTAAAETAGLEPPYRHRLLGEQPDEDSDRTLWIRGLRRWRFRTPASIE